MLDEKAKKDLFSDAQKNEASSQIKSNLHVYSQNEKLKEATKSMLDSENTAIEIEGLLNNNSETLKRSLNRVDFFLLRLEIFPTNTALPTD